ncbi:MAG: lipoprotein [Exilispira sp.]
MKRLMKKLLWIIFLLLTLTGCSRINLMTSDMTPSKWLETHPYILLETKNGPFIISEPSSSIIIFSLFLILGILGIKILKDKINNKSLLFWGVGLILWSLSTLFAGISYQIFSYMLKCSGRDLCLWTTWWEIAYYFFFVISMNIIVIATSYSSFSGKSRKYLIFYALLNFSIYSILLFSGALIPNKLLCSFEFMVLFIGPSFLFLMIYNLIQYRKTKTLIEIRLFQTWLFLFLTTALYFSYYISGLGEILWQRKIWFNANDLLHIGLILWSLFFIKFVKPYIVDKKE